MMFVWIVLSISIRGVAAEYHKAITLTSAPGLQEDSLFGFSVAFQPLSNRLIVGAPKADHVGQVYTNDLQTDNWTLSKVDLDDSERKPKNYTKDKATQEYSDYWLGATVAASSSFYVACAPLFMKVLNHRFKENGKIYNEALHLNQGQCFIEDKKGDVMTKLKQMNYYKRITNGTRVSLADTEGWSLNIASDNSILVGGPSMQSFDRGSVLLYKNSNNEPETIKIFFYNVDMIKLNLGFNVASGNYFSKNKADVIHAIGSSYGKYGEGEVIFIRNKETIHRITDKSAGNMFSAALCSATLDDDGKTDLLVGAPTSYADDATEDLSYDVGAVHVYFSDANQKLRLQWTLWGTKGGGYFGFAIANIGDMDGDKRDEIVIAAPYEDEGRGVIYLYKGKEFSGGTPPKYEQRIEPEATGVRYFGFSLTALMDFDNYGSYGLAVGSPGSAKVAILKHITIISIDIRVIENAQLRVNLTKFKFQCCLDVTRPPKPQRISASLNLNVTIRHPDAKIAPDGTRFIAYPINVENETVVCKDIFIVTPKDGDYSKHIKYSIIVDQRDSPNLRSEYNSSQALLINSPVQKQGDVWAETDCQIPGKCQPVLSFSLNTSLPDHYMVGSTNSENVSINILNSGETAYNASLVVEVMGVNILRKTPDCAIIGQGKLFCRPPIMHTGRNWETVIVLETSALTSQDSSVTVVVKLYDNENMINTSTSVFNLMYDVAGINVTEKSERGLLIGMTDRELYYDGKMFKQIYWIRNIGVTNWGDIRCRIVVENHPYIRYTNIKIFTQQLYIDCPFEPVDSSQTTLSVVCNVGNMKRKEAIDVHVEIIILPDTLNDVLAEKNLTISSTIEVMNFNNIVLQTKTFEGNARQSVTSFVNAVSESRYLYTHGSDHGMVSDHSETEDGREFIYNTLLMWIRKKSPWWIIAVGVLFGLVLLSIIVMILYKTGFLKRKKKENLVQLKRRASQRMSMRSSSQRNSITNGSGFRISLSDSPRCSSVLSDDGRRSEIGDPRGSTIISTNQRRRSVIMDVSEVIRGPENRGECRNRIKSSRADEDPCGSDWLGEDQNVIVHN